MKADVWAHIVSGLPRGAALLVKTDLYEAVEDGVRWIALALMFIAPVISFASCTIAVVVLPRRHPSRFGSPLDPTWSSVGAESYPVGLSLP
jgi:hypothetical protein